MSAPLRVSVVIPTLNRAAVLCETLESLLAIVPTDGSVEVRVVDQSPELEPEAAAQLAAWERAGRIHHHRVTFRGTTKARNFGALQSRGEVVVYLDDDVLLPPGFLEAHLAAYEDKDLAGIAGAVLHEGEKTIGSDQLTRRQRADWRAGRLVLFNADFAFPTLWARGCNMSFRRDWILRAGGFDENFYGVAVGEEPEFCHRLRQAGGTLRFVPETRLFHRAVASGGSRDEARQREGFIAYADNACYYRWSVEASPLKRLSWLLGLARAMLFNRRIFLSDLWPKHLLWFFIGVRQGLQRQARRSRQDAFPHYRQTA